MSSLTPGEQVGRYIIEAEAGRGGMGVVYRAIDPALSRPVALKLLAPHMSTEGRPLERFRREAAALAQLKHPHIALVYEFGEHRGQPFIALEWVNGRTLRAILDEERRLPLPRSLGILDQVADALDYAHAHGVIHRDIKPSNILVDAAGSATLVDFGLARMMEAPALTAGSEFFGTPHYLTPEQINGRPVDGRADQYCLALVAYDMLAGRSPFEATTWPGLVHAHLYEAPTPITELNPALPADVEAALLKALAKDPAHRFANAGEFAAALRPAPRARYPSPTVAAGPAELPKPLPISRPAPPVPAEPPRQTGFLIALGAVLLVMVLSGLLWLGPRIKWSQGGTPTPLAAGATETAVTQTPESATDTPGPAPSPTTPAIELAPGATYGEVAGTLEADESRSFLVSALGAQPLIVRLSSPHEDVVLGIAGPPDRPPLLDPVARQTAWEGLLPSTDTYTLTAVATGGAADFRLSVELPQRIVFAPGATSYVVTSTVPISQPVAYVLRALAGQTLTATITSPGGPVYLGIDGLQDGQPLVRSALELSQTTVSLPASQDYILRAIPGGPAPTTFTLTITIVGPAPGPALATTRPGGVALAPPMPPTEPLKEGGPL